MTTVVFDISMSLDGYITDVEQTPENGLGREGERLHAWLGGTDEDLAALTPATAIVTGHRTLVDSLPYWGADGPSGERRIPVMVLSRSGGSELPADSVYRFADSPAAALRLARELAGDGDVCVMGGAMTAQSFFAEDLIDEVSLHLMPVMFGGGTRLFDGLPPRLTELEQLSVVPTKLATHLRYRVVR
ncbi:MAG: dihydrofolate reductase family protein [Protaetiibacter sp.]